MNNQNDPFENRFVMIYKRIYLPTGQEWTETWRGRSEQALRDEVEYWNRKNPNYPKDWQYEIVKIEKNEIYVNGGFYA